MKIIKCFMIALIQNKKLLIKTAVAEDRIDLCINKTSKEVKSVKSLLNEDLVVRICYLL